MNREQCDKLKAIESLRGGVPNRSVVRFIPPIQPEIDQAFGGLLASIQSDDGAVKSGMSRPLLLQGGFGTGKTHWIESLLNRALEEGFVCSWISLSKEVPLYDLAKIYRASIQNSVAERRTGSAIREIVSEYNADRAPGHRDFVAWILSAESHGSIDPRLSASFGLFSNSSDEEVRGDILNEWMGFPMKAGDFKRRLEEARQPLLKKIPRVVTDNYLQRFEFLSRLIRAAGYNGWIVFLDEAEMVSKYSLRQRARSYANLARLMGAAATPRPAALGVVATITPDYSSAVLRSARKNDIESIPAKLPNTKDESIIDAAAAGMRIIDRQGILIDKPTPATVRRVYDTLAGLYSQANGGWTTPDVFGQIEYAQTTSIRKYIRIWINVWDMRRIYNYDAQPEVSDVIQNYDEDSDYQAAAADGAETIV